MLVMYYFAMQITSENKTDPVPLKIDLTLKLTT